MARTVDPTRKPALVDLILDYLLDKPLSEMTFRTLAKGIGVSTYALVYHFGTREQLVRDIVAAISSRAIFVESRLRQLDATLETYLEGLELSWSWAIEPRNRQLQRLEFEAALLEAVRPGEVAHVRALIDHWQSIGRDALLGFGLSAKDAEAESRFIVGVFHGLQYDLVVTGDVEAASRAFRRALVQHRRAIEELLAAH
jgi:AcrR family transcriptional regulator